MADQPEIIESTATVRIHDSDESADDADFDGSANADPTAYLTWPQRHGHLLLGLLIFCVIGWMGTVAMAIVLLQTMMVIGEIKGGDQQFLDAARELDAAQTAATLAAKEREIAELHRQLAALERRLPAPPAQSQPRASGNENGSADGTTTRDATGD